MPEQQDTEKKTISTLEIVIYVVGLLVAVAILPSVTVKVTKGTIGHTEVLLVALIISVLLVICAVIALGVPAYLCYLHNIKDVSGTRGPIPEEMSPSSDK